MSPFANNHRHVAVCMDKVKQKVKIVKKWFCNKCIKLKKLFRERRRQAEERKKKKKERTRERS